jgi:hypothetical protein
MSEPTPRRVLVACRDASGAPTLYPAVVPATPEQMSEAQHYRSAERQARDDGYELPGGPVICIDAKDAKHGGFQARFHDFFDMETTAVETGRMMPQSDASDQTD